MAVPIRRITRVFTATRQREGAGFIVAQPVPHARLRESESDPFLMLHAFGPVMVDHRSPGAPWHPHRGFDTVTYLLQGESQHQDSMGNKGTIKGGEVQWMRAGSGIIHDEGSNGMTRDDPPRPSEGFQIWVNLPSHLKMSPPDYRQLTAETFKWVDYTQFDSTGTKVKLIAGDFQAADGSAPVLTSPLNDALAIPVVIADVRLVPGGRAKIAIDPSFETLIVYVFQGSARLFNGDVDATGTVLKRDDCALLSEEPGILYLAALEAPEYTEAVVEDPKTSKDLDANAVGLHGASILILAGRKIREPVARHGPFVMNTPAELQQAFEDYHNGKLATVKGAETKY